MKKLLLTSALLATSLFTFAQNPAVPNGDFENWEAADCGGEIPSKYNSAANLDAQEDEMPCPDETGIIKSTTKYSGTYALEIKPQIFVFEIPPIAVPTEVTSEEVSEDISEEPFTIVSGNGIYISENFTGRPTKLVGYTKFTKGGTDELTIYVDLIGANEEEIGGGFVTISESQTDYTKFEITLKYDEKITATPAQLMLGITLGTIVPAAMPSASEGEGEDEDNMVLTADAGSSALIDAFSFTYPTIPTSVNYQSTSSINVFAANKTINFSENVSDVRVVDMVGASQLQQAASLKTLNAATLNTGLYIVTYKYNDNYYSKKVVIE